MMSVHKLVGVLACLSLFSAAPAEADVVTFWHNIAQPIIAARGPAGTIDYAMVQVAVHDAIQAYQQRFEPYAYTPTSPVSGSPIAAAAAAAHRVLVNRFPSQETTLNTELANYLSSQGLVGDDGLLVGVQAADAIIANRANDGAFPIPPTTFFGGTQPGEWRPTSFNPPPPEGDGLAISMTTPWLANTVPFTLRDSSQYLRFVGPPPQLHSRKYANAYNEVKRLGAVDSVRTAEQNAIRTFFTESAVIYWHRTIRGIADSDPALTDSGDKARLIALVSLAMADAVITAWNSKVHYNFWRPITAIRLGDTDGNPRTEGDAGWTPASATPNYPDHTSGANAVTGATTRTLELYFGTDERAFAVMGAGGATRAYTRFSDAAADVVEARILQGIHFRFADVGGRNQGRRVARWAFKRFLQPVDAVDVDAVDDEEEQEDEQ